MIHHAVLSVPERVRVYDSNLEASSPRQHVHVIRRAGSRKRHRHRLGRLKRHRSLLVYSLRSPPRKRQYSLAAGLPTASLALTALAQAQGPSHAPHSLRREQHTCAPREAKQPATLHRTKVQPAIERAHASDSPSATPLTPRPRPQPPPPPHPVEHMPKDQRLAVVEARAEAQEVREIDVTVVIHEECPTRRALVAAPLVAAPLVAAPLAAAYIAALVN